MAGLTRRQFLHGLGAAVAVQSAGPFVVRGSWTALAGENDPALRARNRLVVLFLSGGNDGLHTVAPWGDVAGAPRRSVYERVRPWLAWPADALLPLDHPDDADQRLGLNPHGAFLHQLYRSGRLAVVQGVDYPDHSYSHFVSAPIWQSGLPDDPRTGWVGRHLDRSSTTDHELRAVAVGARPALALRGERGNGMVVGGLPLGFRDAAASGAEQRHAALARFASHPAAEPMRRRWGQVAASSVRLVSRAQALPLPPYGPTPVVNDMLTARALLESELGVESVFLGHGGFDTHANQHHAHHVAFHQLDEALEVFFAGTSRGADLGIGPLAADVADRTLVVICSEFGRRIGETGGPGVAGTDHGAAGPVLLVGPPGPSPATGAQLVAGLHGDHPPMGTVRAPADNLAMTTELRQLYQAVLTSWLADPDPRYEAHGFQALPGLFR